MCFFNGRGRHHLLRHLLGLSPTVMVKELFLKNTDVNVKATHMYFVVLKKAFALLLSIRGGHM